jgi:hypothetical protein
MAPVSRRKTGASASTETVDVDLVADIHPAEAGHPSPAAGSDHHDAAEANLTGFLNVLEPRASVSSVDEGQRPNHRPRCDRQYDRSCEHQTQQTE